MIFIHVVCLPGSIHCALGVGPLAPLGPPATESALLPLDWCPIRGKILFWESSDIFKSHTYKCMLGLNAGQSECEIT